MMTQADRARLLGALSLGLGRQKLPDLPGLSAVTDEDQRALAALALAGQLARFTPPPRPLWPDAPWRLPDDDRPPLPSAARAALLRLIDRMDAVALQALAPLLLIHVARAGCRLHPFDFPRLGPLLRQPHPSLGPPERAWRDRGSGTEPTVDALTAETMTAETWRDGEPAERTRYLRALRKRDPDAGRELLAACFAAEPAKLRGELLAALNVRLGPDDRAFLELCASDRAASVKQAAEAMLARLPGSALHEARMTVVRGAFSIETKGLLRRHKVFVYRPPTEQKKPVPVSHLIADLGLAELAAALGVAAADMPAMATDDDLRLALAVCALRDAMADLAADLLRQMDAPVWSRDIELLGTTLPMLPHPARADFAMRVWRADAVIGGNWSRLAGLLGAPLHAAFVESLLSSKPWHTYVADNAAAEEKRDADPVFLYVTALIPAAMATRLRDSVAPIDQARRMRTTLLLGFLDSLPSPPR
jgi:hypothetical protein